jgi:hypothetical protein
MEGGPFGAPASITDVSAWCCLAISHFGHTKELRRGLEFILQARTNEGSKNEDGWGFTTFEPDRVYSTWIASYCFSRIVRASVLNESDPLIPEMIRALREAKDWICSIKHQSGGWGVSHDRPPQCTSTAVALLTLFIQGDNPADFKSSLDFLRFKTSNGLWPAEIEIVVTREGYELPQEWFTSALCFRALIFFAEFGLASLDELHASFRGLVDLIRPDGGVPIWPGADADLVWTIPYMLDVLEKYRLFIATKEQEYRLFLEKKTQEYIQKQKIKMEQRLQHEFPYPVSHVFFSFQHELDFQRRFQLLLQFYEITIKYVTVVGVAGYLSAKERNESINGLLAGAFKRPSLGDWCSLLHMLLKLSPGFERLLAPGTANDILAPQLDYLDDTQGKQNLSQVLSHITSLRNTTSGHGALRTLYEYKLMAANEESRVYSFFDRVDFLARSNSFLVLASEYDDFGEGDKYKIRIFKGLNISDSDLETVNRLSEGQRETLVRYIYFQNADNNMIVNLYPFVSYMFCTDCKREHFFFYNSRKDKLRVAYLSYECGHTMEKDNGIHFQKRLSSSDVNWT